MSDREIKKKYLLKIKEITRHNQLYFNKSKPIISDKDYDKLKKEVIELEKKFTFLKSNASPLKIIGFKPSKNFIKAKHRTKMLSLSNTFNKDDLENFEKKILNFLNKDKNFKLEYSVEPKIDGISASLTYKNGIFVSGLSRGDGQQGELITENLKTITDIPKKIISKNFPNDIDIRGEVYIQNKPICNFNGGRAVIGIQNTSGTIGFTPNNRNTSQWNASNEAWRFTPDGTSVFSIDWYDNSGALIGTGDTILVCPTATTTYSADVTYDICDGTQVTQTDQITITISGGASTTSSVDVNSCVPYTWNGNTYSSSGIYSDTTIYSTGCLIIDSLILTINNSTIWYQTHLLCDGDSIVVGSSVYDTTGAYIDTLSSANGCDSIVNTYLMIDENTSSYDTLSVGASIVWNGMPLNVSGDYSVTLINSAGCDSIANINFTLNIF